ncbi:MAG: hypothetical protein JW722_04190 [Demequinaceae bacterium]|nr:hypothetical protein [Demequinaceae bacterium]
MSKRLKTLGAALAVIGLVFIAGGVFAFMKVKAGADSLQAFSAAQDVTLSYDEEGQLVDRGTVEGAQAILALLEDDWKYPVNMGELDPDDPLVNTGSEYMYQMATVAYHTLHGTQTIVLTEDKEYNGELFPAGEYSFEVDGRYWTDFDRSHPLEGPAREKAWTGTVHGLIAELGVGSVTASTLQMGYGIAGLLGGIGLTSIVAGLGLIWVSMGAPVGAPGVAAKPAAKPMPTNDAKTKAPSTSNKK